MATSPNLIRLSTTSQEGLVQYAKRTSEFSYSTWDFRSQLTSIDKEYYRENITTTDQQKAQTAVAYGDKRKIADLVVPIVEPQIETSLAFLTSIFLTGNPIFGVVAPPDQMQQAKIFEALIDEHAKHGSWTRELIMFLRDGLKYNFHAIEICWWLEKTYAPYTSSTAAGATTEQREIIWQGNRLRRCDPYNTLFDPRVVPAEMHKKAEFVGYVELLSRVALKEFIQNLPTRINVKEAFECATGSLYRYFIPEINWDSLIRQNISRGFDWMSWATLDNGNNINYKNTYEVATRYCRIVPSDFNIDVPAKNTPQIWKLITINDEVLVFAEKQTNAHNFLPILFGQPIEDGLGYQTKSLASRLVPLQDSASAFWNARLAAKRRSVADRGLFNPLLVREADINSDNPSAKIPVRPNAYGKPLTEAYYPIPYEDRDSGSFVQDAAQMMAFANFVSGQNPVQQGQFVKGNKTDTQFQDTQNSSSGRQQMMAQFIEDQVFVPLKDIIKINILQYQTSGQIYSLNDQQVYNIDPIQLRQTAMGFKIADGLLPKSKLVSDETLQVAMQTVAAVPGLQQGYNLPKMFSYLMESRGLDLEPFILAQPVQQAPAAAPGGQPVPQGASRGNGATAPQQQPAAPQQAVPTA